ncbi:MAG TPA: hypothetical protein VFB17_06145 [Gaiellaceae bacterium]|nr:hypothetical protein [Gaiellaceae bacterium]
MKLGELLGRLLTAAGGPGSFAVVGAVARNAWAPPRATTDVDVTVLADERVLAAVGATLASLGYVRVREHRTDPDDPLPDVLVFRSRSAAPRQVDLLVAKTSFEREVLSRAVAIDVDAQPVPVASAEDLVVYKLIADRPRDRDDIAAVLRTQARAGRDVDWSYVERWARFWAVTDRLERLRREGRT